MENYELAAGWRVFGVGGERQSHQPVFFPVILIKEGVGKRPEKVLGLLGVVMFAFFTMGLLRRIGGEPLQTLIVAGAVRGSERLTVLQHRSGDVTPGGLDHLAILIASFF